MRKSIWRMMFIFVSLMVICSVGYANEQTLKEVEFEGGIGELSSEERLVDWFNDLKANPEQELKRVEGTIASVDPEEIILFGKAAEVLGIGALKSSAANSSSSMLKSSGHEQSRYEKLLAETRGKPVINPPAPITSRLVDEIGLWPNGKSLGLVEHVEDGVFLGYILLIGVREINGGPAQARLFETKYFDLLDGSRHIVDAWKTTNQYFTVSDIPADEGGNGRIYWFSTDYYWNPMLMDRVAMSYEVWWGKPWHESIPPTSIYGGWAISVPNIEDPQGWF